MPQYKDSLRYELAKKKIDENFSRWLSLASTSQLIQKLLDDCKLPNPAMSPPPAIFSNKLGNISSPGSGSPKRSSLTPPLSPPTYDRLSSSHSHSLPGEIFIQPRTFTSINKAGSLNLNIPQFFFPKGKPVDPSTSEKNSKILSNCFFKDSLKAKEFEEVTFSLCGLPKFLTQKLLISAGSPDSITKAQFLKF